MKKCKDCNVKMIEGSSLHTDYVGGVKFEEQIFLDYDDEKMELKCYLVIIKCLKSV